MNDMKITPLQWNELSPEGKEKLRQWSVNHGFELDLIPGSNGSFDPVCEYAALLTKVQMNMFLQENDKEIPEENDSTLLWENIVKLLK